MEGTNSKLLGRLKRRCAPDLGEDEWAKITSFKDLPYNWPDHFDAALKDLNDRILPALEFTPRELLTGHVVNTISTPEHIAVEAPTADDIHTQHDYTMQQQLDAYSHVVEHANEREAIFNRNIDKSSVKKLVTFHTNDLVQIYRSDLDYTFRTNRKLLPKWGQVRRVVSRDVNSYKLASLEGLLLKGRFSARRLRRFETRPGTTLDDQQKALEAAATLLRTVGTLSAEETEDVPEEGVDDAEEAPAESVEPADEDERAMEEVATDEAEEDAEATEARMREEGQGEEEFDDGLPKGGWSEPGRLRTRAQRKPRTQ